MIYQRDDIDRVGYGAVCLLTILVMTGGHSAVVLGAPPQEAVIEGGGAESPPGGGRPDAQTPQLGTGNRGTGQRGGGASSVDPSKVRSEVTGPGRVIGQVLIIDGDSYVVRDKHGHELTFRIDRDTAVEGLINMGAKIAADVEVDGRVSRLQLIQ